MFNKKGQTGGAEQIAGFSVLEMLGLFVLFFAISQVIISLFFQSSIDSTSINSFNRLDNSIRNVAFNQPPEMDVAIDLDRDYAFVFYNRSEGIENPHCKGIIKPPMENKCGDKACLCICKNSEGLGMCTGDSSECKTYEFEFTHACGYIRGKEGIFSLNLLNDENKIAVSVS